jgi:hypothetical protein
VARSSTHEKEEVLMGKFVHDGASLAMKKKRRKRVRVEEPVRCIAHSSRTGLPCKKWPMKGQNVCRNHGGAAPAARRRAAERIALASDKAAAQLIAFMNDESVPHNVRLAAAKDLLDRAQVSGKQTVELEIPAWQQILEGVVATVEPGAPMRQFAEAQPAPDPLVVEAERVEAERELARYQAEPHDADWSDGFAYGSEPPRRAPAQEPAEPMRNGADRPPPAHPLPERRRIEPDDPDYWVVPRTYTPSARPPRKGRIAGRRR